jgi:hypothetical protein
VNDLARRAGALLGRLRAWAGGRAAADDTIAALRARWPHRVRGWLDPDVQLTGWRTTVDVADAGEVVRAVASSSGGRLGDAEVAEVLDALAAAEPGETVAFRFGPRGLHAFFQIWIGAIRQDGDRGGVKISLLSDMRLVDEVGAALSIGGFRSAERRAEFDRLRRFLVAALLWRWTAAPAAAERGGERAGGSEMAERLERILSDPGAPLLELLRGLRRRTAEILDDTRDLDRDAVADADAWLSARGVPTLSEMRTRWGAAGDR